MSNSQPPRPPGSKPADPSQVTCDLSSDASGLTCDGTGSGIPAETIENATARLDTVQVDGQAESSTSARRGGSVHPAQVTSVHLGSDVTLEADPTQPLGLAETLGPEADERLPNYAVTGDFSSATQDFSVGTRGKRSTAISRDGRVHIAGYEVLGELGRGGMGVVYKARQVSLDRPVAIKMVLAGGHAGPEQIARFHNEAQAVAALRHPNIVQIYEVGECDNLPYFSLEFVDGTALDRALGGKPWGARETALLMETLARAMHFAHQQGIVHRDLKPANILLTSDGIPKITDFGLAKKLEGDSGQTKSGALMGTPSYMAPEQARGEFRELGPVADVHALGAMMYEMLVGRPPFLGSSPIETIMQVIHQEPVPPSRLVSQLPPDLETICLKCLQKDLGKRYPTAEALAEDLRLFLADEPILSRPVSQWERLARWCRKNPKLAALTSAVAALLLLVAITSTLSAAAIRKERDAKEHERLAAVAARDAEERQKNAARLAEQRAVAAQLAAEEQKTAADNAKQLAEEARVEADKNADIASSQLKLAIETMRTLIVEAQTQLDQVPGTQKVKMSLLEMAIAGLNDISKRAEGASKSETSMLAARKQMGATLLMLGQTELAASEFEQCYEIARRRVEAEPANLRAKRNLVLILHDLGQVREQLDRDMTKALAYYQEGAEIAQSLHLQADRDENLADYDLFAYILGRSRLFLGVALLKLGRIQEADPELQNCLQLREELLTLKPDDPTRKQEVAIAYNAIAEVSLRLGRAAAAREQYQRGLEIIEELRALAPEDHRIARMLASIWGNYGDLLLSLHDYPAAADYFQRALELTRQLAAADGENADLADELSTAEYRVGMITRRLQGDADAQQYFQRCLELREQLFSKDPTNVGRRTQLMLALAYAGRHSQAAGMAEETLTGDVDPETAFTVARGLAQCAAGAALGEPSLVEEYTHQALAALRKAIAAGYNDRFAIENEPDLEPLREQPGYKALLKELDQQPAVPAEVPPKASTASP
jgi:eukaryotic-like serine/threonine-protein kinase